MKIVIIGGVAAGAKAAAKAKRILPDAEIDIYTEDTHVSYSACGIPYYIEGNFDDYRTLLVRSPEEFRAGGINVHLLHKVTKIIPVSKQVLVHDIEANISFLVEYDKLIIATGASPIIPPIKNNCFKNIFSVRTINDAINIKKRLPDCKRAVIIGGGYIGIEMLEALVRNNIHTTLIERGSHIMPVLDEDMSVLVEEHLASINAGRFTLIINQAVTEFCGDEDGVHTVKTSNGDVYEADMVIICAGVKPNVQLAVDAGIKLGITGAIKVNKQMETSESDIYACGDCCEETQLISQTPVWMPLGSNANKEGRCAAINACGGFDEFHGVLSSAVTRCLNLTIAMTGLTERVAEKLGYLVAVAKVTKHDKVGYMPDANDITIKLIADKKTGKLLGGQAMGVGDSDKRINTLTTALLGGLTVDEFARNDLTYAPPFSTTIDPLLDAAQILIAQVDSK